MPSVVNFLSSSVTVQKKLRGTTHSVTAENTLELPWRPHRKARSTSRMGQQRAEGRRFVPTPQPIWQGGSRAVGLVKLNESPSSYRNTKHRILHTMPGYGGSVQRPVMPPRNVDSRGTDQIRKNPGAPIGLPIAALCGSIESITQPVTLKDLLQLCRGLRMTCTEGRRHGPRPTARTFRPSH